jgi:hypothetical protein
MGASSRHACRGSRSEARVARHSALSSTGPGPRSPISLADPGPWPTPGTK